MQSVYNDLLGRLLNIGLFFPELIRVRGDLAGRVALQFDTEVLTNRIEEI